MTIFIDFDDTLFDTERFKEYLWRGHIIKYFTHFKMGELDQFMYPDVEAFLDSTEGYDREVVTFGSRFLQSQRIKSCSLVARFKTVTFCNWHAKGPVLKRLSAGLAAPIVYIDNHPKNLESVARNCPAITLVRMRRNNGPYSNRSDTYHHHEVTNLEELLVILRQI